MSEEQQSLGYSPIYVGLILLAVVVVLAAVTALVDYLLRKYTLRKLGIKELIKEAVPKSKKDQ